MSKLDDLLIELASGSDERASISIAAISALGEEAVPSIAKLLDEDDPDTRWWSLRALSEFNSASVTSFLIRGLRDPDLKVRQCAALGLRDHPSLKAVDELIAQLGNQDRTLARLAGDALTAVGKDAVEILISVIEKGNPNNQLEAVRALALIKDYSAVTTLFKLLDSDSALVEYWANKGLDDLGIGMNFFSPD